MASKNSVCKHLNQVIDEHEGIYICIDCAHVISPHFTEEKYINIYESQNFNYDVKTETSEILSKLNLPDRLKTYCHEPTTKTKTISNTADKVTNIYLKINENDSLVTLKEISAVTGIHPKNIAKNKTNILNKKVLLEKYCTLLGLDYKTYTLIKERLKCCKVSGHNPLTVVASIIYIHSKQYKLKLSMKKIAEQFGISPISIQRYLKI